MPSAMTFTQTLRQSHDGSNACLIRFIGEASQKNDQFSAYRQDTDEEDSESIHQNHPCVVEHPWLAIDRKFSLFHHYCLRAQIP